MDQPITFQDGDLVRLRGTHFLMQVYFSSKQVDNFSCHWVSANGTIQSAYYLMSDEVELVRKATALASDLEGLAEQYWNLPVSLCPSDVLERNRIRIALRGMLVKLSKDYIDDNHPDHTTSAYMHMCGDQCMEAIDKPEFNKDDIPKNFTKIIETTVTDLIEKHNSLNQLFGHYAFNKKTVKDYEKYSKDSLHKIFNKLKDMIDNAELTDYEQHGKVVVQVDRALWQMLNKSDKQPTNPEQILQEIIEKVKNEPTNK